MKPTHLLLATALLLSSPALAQTTPTAYEFLTVAECQSYQASASKVLFAPAFQGKTEVALADLPAGNKFLAVYRQNLEVVNQQLADVTAAGWELVNVSTIERAHEYLFRRAKK
ncbi:MAG: hypothetical protein ACRYFX_24115 [Janthinobacterium lividum]